MRTVRPRDRGYRRHEHPAGLIQHGHAAVVSAAVVLGIRVTAAPTAAVSTTVRNSPARTGGVMVCDSCAATVSNPCAAERVSGLCLICLTGTPPDPGQHPLYPPLAKNAQRESRARVQRPSRFRKAWWTQNAATA
jgi:hypothetical protein